jgi:glycerate dehydrogenase
MAKVLALDTAAMLSNDVSGDPFDRVSGGSFVLRDGTLSDHVVDLLELHQPKVLHTNKVQLGSDELELFKELGGLGVIVEATGTDIVDKVAAKKFGLPVCNSRGYAREAVAQMDLAYILYYARCIGELDSMIAAGNWPGSPTFNQQPPRTCHLLRHYRLGVVGMGDIGATIATYAKFFGMDVMAFDPKPKFADVCPMTSSVEELLANCHITTLHCPGGSLNLGAKELSHMPKDSLLINSARADLVEPQGLIERLGRNIAMACLDVEPGSPSDVEMYIEPPRAMMPLMIHPRVLNTGHNAWNTLESRQQLMKDVIDLTRFLLLPEPVVYNNVWDKDSLILPSAA